MTKKQIPYRGGLKPFCGERRTFTARVADYGVGRDPGTVYPTLLVREIKHDDEIVADHPWIKNQYSEVTSHRIGELISFSAVVKPYVRGYREMKRCNGDLSNGYCFDGVIIDDK
jgi:hypothetical protein